MSGNQPNQRIMNLSIHDLIFINASAFNILLPILVVLFIRIVPQANHIIFSKISGVDPVSTTGLIIVYTIFVMFVYYSQEEKYLDLTTNKLDLSIVFQKVNLVTNFIPLSIWLLTILFNDITHHFLSIFFTVLFMVSMAALIKSDKKYSTLIHSSISYLVYLIALALLICGAFIFNDFSDGTYAFLIPVSLYVVLSIILIISIVFIDNRTLSSRFSIVTSSIIIITILILIKIGFKKIYSPANILLLYVLILRIVLFLISRSFIILDKWKIFGRILIYKAAPPQDEFETDEIKRYKSKKAKTERVLVLTFASIFIFIFFYPGNRDQHDMQTLEITNNRILFNDYITHWLKQDTSSAPIFLIAGQGGGSRAGSVFFQTLSELDPIVKDNLLSINTISGSGVGAQFYLSAKYTLGRQYELLFKNPATINRANTILFQKDYISNSLFKILFSDYIRSKFGRKSSAHARNAALMHLEKEAYFNLEDSFHFKQIKSDSLQVLNSAWSQVYDTLKLRQRKFPLFFPTSYNVQYAVKAISSPVKLPYKRIAPFFDILDSLGSNRNLLVIQSVALNQLFPVLSASATLDSFNYMDGGVYDNLGFETLFDLYKITTSLRDSLAPDRKIILISIENGAYEPKIEKGKLSDLSAVSSAASSSIFSSVPKEHKIEGMRSLYCQDTFFQLRIFIDTIKTGPPIINFFKYQPRKDDVIMSRYLTQNEINIISAKTNTEVKEFKMELDDFLLRKSDLLKIDCHTSPRVISKAMTKPRNKKRVKPP